MVKEDLETKFKDPQDPFRLVFVCAMWLTGFDAPCCHTMYVDKPMAGHNLMQAIARVNQVFAGKDGGLVVDYIGIAAEVNKVLAANERPITSPSAHGRRRSRCPGGCVFRW